MIETTQSIEVREGILSWAGIELRVSFRIKIGQLGEITLEIDAVQSSNREWPAHWQLWHDLLRSNNRQRPYFHLSGLSACGLKVYSEFAHLENLVTSSTPGEVTLQPMVSVSELNLERPSPACTAERDVSATYLSLGQLGSPHRPVDTTVGTLFTSATSSVAAAKEKFGAIRIVKNVDLSLDEWIKASDDLAERVLNILSLAQGRWLMWTAREVAVGDDLVSKRIRSHNLSDAVLAQLFPHLDLEPVLQLAVQSYTRDLILQTKLDVALSWMLAPAPYAETRILNQLIALELLVSTFENKASPLIPKKIFSSKVVPRLREALADLVESGVLEPTQKESLNKSLADLNRPTFFDKVRQLMKHYKVPVNDIDERELRHVVVGCRNDLVHRGFLEKIGKDRGRINRASDIAEELLKRIVMAMLNYEGKYISALYNLAPCPFNGDRIEPPTGNHPVPLIPESKSHP